MTAERNPHESLTSYFKFLEATNPAAAQVFVAESEDQFIEALEKAVNEAVVRLESGAKLLMTLDEPTLSWMLVGLLEAAGINASPETYHNGHVDVLVRHPRRPLVSIGECKLHDGYAYHVRGCKQLLDRYSSGRSKRGFCLDFFQVAGMYKKLANLKESFRENKPLRQQGEPEPHATIKGAFVSTHIHVTETPVEILHLGCNCYHVEVKSAGLPEKDAEPSGAPAEGR